MSVVAAAALLLLQGIAAASIACIAFVQVFLTPSPKGLETGALAVGLAAATLIYWALISVPFALVLAWGVWHLRAWARAGTAFFEVVQAVLAVGLFGARAHDLTLINVTRWGAAVGIPIAVLVLIFGNTGQQAFAAARPNGWRF